jgi:hypothetical protein
MSSSSLLEEAAATGAGEAAAADCLRWKGTPSIGKALFIPRPRRWPLEGDRTAAPPPLHPPGVPSSRLLDRFRELLLPLEEKFPSTGASWPSSRSFTAMDLARLAFILFTAIIVPLYSRLPL